MKKDLINPNLIVKNGVYLFIRLLLVMAMAFYTTRLTLQILGDVDYGINNIIGGVISMFAIVSMPITGALQRFFNVEFTKQELPSRVIFSTSWRIIAILAIGMTLLYETLGLYLVNYVLKYPAERAFVVNVIFQITVVTTISSFFSLVYSSLLYAKEDMVIPSTIEVLTAVLKLFLLFLIPYVTIDALVAYTILILFISVFQLVFYYIYCIKKYEESRLCWEKDLTLQKDILKFAGWSSINAVAGISLTYLSNIIINIFGGVLYNTAYGISSQLSNAVVSFSTNVMKAVDPQITSTTVSEQNDYRDQLTLSTIKVSFLGVGFFYIVFAIYGNYLLELWLGHVPLYVFDFCRISLLNILFTSIILPLRTIILATGQIRQLFVNYGVMSVLAIAMMAGLLYMGWPIITVMYLILIVSFCYFINAVIIVDRLSSLHKENVFRDVIKVSFVLFFGYLLLFLFKSVGSDRIVFIFLHIVTLLLFEGYMSYLCVLSKNEKLYIKNVLKKYRNEKCNY